MKKNYGKSKLKAEMKTIYEKLKPKTEMKKVYGKSKLKEEMKNFYGKLKPKAETKNIYGKLKPKAEMKNIYGKLKLKKDIIGIVLAFLMTGFVAVGIDTDAYQVVAAAREKQVEKINTALSSEFISTQDADVLEAGLDTYQAKEKSASRRALRAQMAQDNETLEKVQGRLEKVEAKTAKNEYQKLATQVEDLSEASHEKFVLATDEKNVETLEKQLKTVEDAEKVQPVRELAEKVNTAKNTLNANQKQVMTLVEKLKTVNQSAATLQKKAYLTPEDQTALKNIQTENAKFFEDADDLTVVSTCQTDSAATLTELTKKQADSEADFKKNKAPAENLLKTTSAFLTIGNLTEDEKTKLKGAQATLTENLSQKNYHPGDLATNLKALQSQYDTFLTSSDTRNAEAKKKAEEEAAKKAAEEAAAQQQAQQAAQQQEAAVSQANSATPPALTQNGAWYQAPAGWKFLKAESGKTYRQVKNPNNFELITDAEASQYSPGHGNGSAKQ